MNEHQHDEPDTIAREGWTDIRVRLRPDIHMDMLAIKERTGQSLNSQINEYCEQRLVPPGGAAKIGRARRRLSPRSDPARAALAYLLGYFGQAAQARKAWPWQGRFAVTEGDTDSLVLAGALAALEIDKREGKGRWGTLAAPSASGR